VHVYCLMGNHYHLLMETPAENPSQIMHHLNGAHTTYFNARRERSGHLVRGRCKAPSQGYQQAHLSTTLPNIVPGSRFTVETA